MQDKTRESDGAFDLCGAIIGAAMRVHTALGAGFLETVYKNALVLELRRSGCRVEPEKPINVLYSTKS